MRTAVRIYTLSMVTILVTLIMACLIQETRYKSDLSSIVDDSLIQSARVVLDERYSVGDHEEFMAEFEQNLFRNISIPPGADVDVYYLGLKTNNILSVIVEETAPFLFFPERTFTVRTQKSVILDKDSVITAYWDVRYHDIRVEDLPEDTSYIHIEGTETLLPLISDSDFSHWEDVNGNTVTNIPADWCKAFDAYAVWKD